MNYNVFEDLSLLKGFQQNIKFILPTIPAIALVLNEVLKKDKDKSQISKFVF